LREAGSCQLIDSTIFAMAGGRRFSTTKARENFEKFNQRGNRKEGQPLRMQQSTTQVDSITRKEGAWGLRRMAMAVGEVKLRGRGDR